MKNFILLLVLVFYCYTGFAQQKMVSAYYPDWSIYSRNYPPSKIPVSKLNQIISAFVFPFVVNGTLGLGDLVTYRGGSAQKGVIAAFTNFTNDQGVAQTTGLAFVDIWADFQITSISPLVPNSHPTFLAGNTNKDQLNNWIATPDRNKQGVLGQLINLRLNNPGLRLVTSVGGWTLAQQFPIIADDTHCRTAFAAACGNFCTSFQLDGMDFDWEFPIAGGTDGTETIDGNPVPAQPHNIHDPENFVMLAKAVKAVLSPLNVKFTIAIAQDPHTVASKYIFPNNKPQWASSTYKGYDGSSLVDWIDYFATMTYDYGGAWLSTTSHQAPLYNSNNTKDPDFDMSVSTFIEKILSLGIPPAQIYMGVPFYGRGWTGVNQPGPNGNGMYQPASTTSKLVGSWDNPSATSEFSASFDYGDLKEGKASNKHQYLKSGVGTGNNGFIEYWDSVTKVPFVYNATTGQLISYDNPQSITNKVQYAMSKNLAGVFTWEITQDDSQNSMTTAMYSNAQSFNVSIHGTISDANGAGIPSVNVSLTDGTNVFAAVSDNSGGYSYSVSALRNYTLSFVKSNFTFLPATRSFSMIQNDTLVTVVGSTSSYTIGGIINFSDGTALTGISVALNANNTNLQTTLTSAGNYSFTNIPGGNFPYTVQPISNFYTFTPANYVYTSLNANQAADNFSAAYKAYTISGTVSSKTGAAISGQTIALSSATTNTSVVTDASGHFSFPNLQANADYTIAPQIVNTYLLPFSMVIKALGKDTAVTIAEPSELVVFGYVKNGAAALPNVIVSMTNDWQTEWAYNHSRTTDANGFYAFELGPSVTQLTNFTLSPGAGTYFPSNYNTASVTASLKANFNTQAATITLAITQPTDSIIYVDANNHISLTSTASTDNGTITGVQYAVNGQILTASNTSGNIWQATWTPTSLKAQDTIIVTATNSGSVTKSISKIVWVGCTANCPNAKPVITLTAPLAASAAQASFTPVAVTATITDDGSVASVQFIIDGTTYTPAQSGTSYSYSFTPTAYKSYSIIINATDNTGLVSSLTTNYLINQPSAFTPLPTPAIIGYWQNWQNTSAPFIPLRNLVSSKYNVIDIAFGVQQSPNQANIPVFTPDPTGYPDVQVFKNEILSLKNAGKPVLLSLGGETGTFMIQSVAEKVAFRNAIINIVDTYGFDGIDIDFEGAAAKFGETSTSLLYNTLTSTRSKLFIDVMKELKAYYGSSFLLTMAPELAYVQGGMVGYPAPAQGDFLPILYNLQNEMDLLQIQYYNYGSEWWMGNSAQAPHSAELIIHEVETLLTGFKLGGTNNYFPAIIPSKLAIGMPATCSSAGPDYNVNIDSLIRGLEYLRTGVKPAGFLYTLQGGPYPAIRGMMDWSINWDATTDCAHQPYDFANKYFAYFTKISNQPPVASITAPASNAVLNIGANTITVVASDPDGSVASVDFYINGVKVSTATSAPYNYTWNSTAAGSYILKAIATDNMGLAGNTAVINVQVVVAGSPTITLTAPANNAQIMPGTVLTLSANAVPSNGSTISKVDFYDGNTLINSAITAPYNYTWNTATAGAHYIYAIATDNSNRTALSATDTIAVFVNYTISGTIAKADNTAIAGVTVTLSGNSQTITTTTDASGNYSFTGGLSGSSYTITPNASGMIFTPQAATITNLASATIANFTLNEGVFFQGTIMDGNKPKAGIYVYVTDATNWWTTPDIITDANGYYKLLIPQDKIGHNFTLELRSWQTWDNSASVQFDRTKYTVAGYTLNSSYQISLPSFTKAATLNFNTSQNTLPIQLSIFDIQKLNSTIKVFWTTVQEINSNYFEVQRSSNGIDWTAIKYIKAAGNSNKVINYSFTDITPINGLNYFRLKQVDANGIVLYSSIKVVSINEDAAMEVLISPNPATNFVNIYIPGGNNQITKIYLYQSNGNLIKQYLTNTANLRIDMPNFNKGLYIFKLVEGNKVTIKRIEIL